jgi:hypothetical protein
MAELKVGLAANRTSYFDKITNTYITLQKPVQSVQYNENDIPATVKRLDKITHALLASVPALVLYEGQLPKECIEAFKDKYMKPFHALTNRDVVVGQRVVTGNMPIADQMLQREVVGQVNTNEPLRNGIDSVGAEVKPNRAFDRADAMLPEEPVAGASVEKAEEVTFQAASVEKPEEKQEEKEEEQEEALELVPEEAPAEKPATKKGSRSKKAE